MTRPISRQAWQEIREHYEDPDWTEVDPEDIEFPEAFVPPVPDPDYAQWLDDHDRRFDDYLSTREGDIGDDSLPPY